MERIFDSSLRNSERGLSLLEVLFALTILSILFLGVTDMILSGKRTSALYQRRLVASQYAENVAESLAIKNCAQVSGFFGKATPAEQLGLMYEPTDEERQLVCRVQLEQSAKILYSALITVADPKGNVLIERKALLTCAGQ